MIDAREFLMRARLDAEALEVWIEAGWLTPRPEAAGRRFSEIDLARVELIRDLKDDLGINDEGVTVILDLLDQMHGLRRTLRTLLSAVSAQPEPLRRRIAADVYESTRSGGLREGPSEQHDPGRTGLDPSGRLP